MRVTEDVSRKSLHDLISLEGRGAVVTGGAQGLGRAIAQRLAEAGAGVLIGDINGDLAFAAAEAMDREFPARVLGTHMDVADSASVAAAADLAARELGGVDIWVNNAGIFPSQKLEAMTDSTWNRVFDVNVRGVFAGAREAARHMIAAGTPGVIVNIVSTAGFKGVAPGLGAYVGSKHAVRGMTKQMALELAPNGIRVLGVAPTYCVTEGNIAAASASPEHTSSAEDIPAMLTSRLGRVGVPDDIARVVLFCASDLSILMTGSTLLVDAGEAI